MDVNDLGWAQGIGKKNLVGQVVTKVTWVLGLKSYVRYSAGWARKCEFKLAFQSFD